MNPPFLPAGIYKLFFALLGAVYFIGLFVPLMDNDSAHHANIALHIYLTGDYVNLVDLGGDYLDKPHLHFWLCACSYEVFGVTAFAYKFPSFLFTILGTWSTYRLGRTLYDKETGKLAALVLASAFAYVLANNDVRMDAILTACIAFAIWQLVEFVNNKKILNAAGAALGLALGFCTKGNIAVFTPAVATLFYILYKRDRAILYNWKWLVMIGLFFLLISPVVYCYYLQYNLHPEKTVRGQDHINGVKFILFSQNLERFSGDGLGVASKTDHFFFLHTFLWAFAPWSIIAYMGFVSRVKDLIKRKEEWLTPGSFAVVIFVISLASFKLPHYLNIVFPSTAVMTAAYLVNLRSRTWIRTIFVAQLAIVAFVLLLMGMVNAWAFPVRNVWVIAAAILLLSPVIHFLRSRQYDRLQKSICVSVSTIILSFFLLNSNFYPRLLGYQGGNRLALAAGKSVDPQRVYFWKGSYSSSFNFYTKALRKEFNDTVLRQGQRTWLVYDSKAEEEINRSGYVLKNKFAVLDYEITKLNIKFMNPATRDRQCSQMILAEMTR